MPHSIRLRGPWEFRVLARWQQRPDGWQLTPVSAPEEGTLAMPGAWPAANQDGQPGRVRFSRRFHRPTGIDATTPVWLVIESADQSATISLNGAPLGAIDPHHCPARFSIANLLHKQNHLELEVTSPQGRAGALGLVTLEIAGPGESGEPLYEMTPPEYEGVEPSK